MLKLLVELRCACFSFKAKTWISEFGVLSFGSAVVNSLIGAWLYLSFKGPEQLLFPSQANLQLKKQSRHPVASTMFICPFSLLAVAPEFSSEEPFLYSFLYEPHLTLTTPSLPGQYVQGTQGCVNSQSFATTIVEEMFLSLQ